MPFPTSAIRRQFPILGKVIAGQPIAYLDNAATTQKPEKVLDAIDNFYRNDNANINRGMHPMAEAATVAYEQARKTLAAFINAQSSREIIFTRNTTEAINLVARSYGENLSKDTHIAISLLEHHSNIVPWQQLHERKGTGIEWIGLTAEGHANIESLKKILAEGKTSLVAITGLSNVLGIATPLKEMIDVSHKAGAKVLVDAAQLIAHETLDVQKLDTDFLAFSGHKLYGPTGIGVLYGKEKLLNAMPPFLGGGDMLEAVGTEGFTPAELPRKFEAGTPNIAGAIGLAAAINWIEEIGADAMHAYTKELLMYARLELQKIHGLRILGPSSGDDLLGCVSFVLDGIHPHDLTEILGREGICLRAGHHCAQPLHKHLGISSSTRLSVAAYNTKEEIDRCCEAIKRAQKFFA